MLILSYEMCFAKFLDPKTIVKCSEREWDEDHLAEDQLDPDTVNQDSCSILNKGLKTKKHGNNLNKFVSNSFILK